MSSKRDIIIFRLRAMNTWASYAEEKHLLLNDDQIHYIALWTEEAIKEFTQEGQAFNLCGECEHWHEIQSDDHKKRGRCDSFPALIPIEKVGDLAVTYEDECYDEEFWCFEGRKQE